MPRFKIKIHRQISIYDFGNVGIQQANYLQNRKFLNCPSSYPPRSPKLKLIEIRSATATLKIFAQKLSP